MMKTLMGIAAENLRASDDEALMPDPVNAWTRPTAVGRLRPLWRITFSSTFIYLGALQSTVA
jgi:hypothetical protein